MSLDSKVIWSEGMFLNPHHFQQQERYMERYVEGRCSAHGAYGWGLHEFEIDSQLLKLGKVSLTRAKGVFPDGTPFSFPDKDDAPPVIELSPNTHNTLVYLAVPVVRPGAIDVLPERDAQGLARYYPVEQGVRDVAQEGGETLSVNVGKLNLRLLLENDDLSGYACIGVMRISETREDKEVLLDKSYIATGLDSRNVPQLVAYVSEIYGMLHQRGESIAGRLADTTRGGTAEIADYMMLQMINRYEPLVNMLANLRGVHPLTLFSQFVQILGEFSTFVSKRKRPPAIPAYQHDNLQACFGPVMAALRQGLSAVYEQTAVALALVERKYGIKVAQISDRSLISTARFVLAVNADVTEEVLRTRLPAQIKIGPVERIRQLVNAAMPGIPIKNLPVVPRQIPYRSGYLYFELERSSDFWKELQHSGGFALHVGGEFPGLQLEFWAIRQ